MPPDRARPLHDPARRYRSVIAQQGRVSLDADVNEADVERHWPRVLTRDVIGPCGGSKGEAGFEIAVDPSGESLLIGAGRYYVDGLLAENEAERTFDRPPDLPVGQYVVYLDVWQRSVTAVERPELREVALGGPDTSSRRQVAWQVRLAPDEMAPCGGSEAASLQVRIPDGYFGLENSLYRIEIHAVGKAGKISFKWSRDNGALVTPLKATKVKPGRWVALEDGLEIAFEGSMPLAGDYWLFTARPATDEVEWLEVRRRPSGVGHACCPLALIEIGEDKGRWRVLEDRRRLFAPLTD